MNAPQIKPGHGGAHVVDGDGNVTSTAPTEDHPEGNAPRDAQGKRIDVVPEAEEAAPPQTTDRPARNRRAAVDKE